MLLVMRLMVIKRSNIGMKKTRNKKTDRQTDRQS